MKSKILCALAQLVVLITASILAPSAACAATRGPSEATAFEFKVQQGKVMLAEQRSGRVIASKVITLPKHVSKNDLRHLALNFTTQSMRSGRIVGNSVFLIATDTDPKGGKYSAVILRLVAR